MAVIRSPFAAVEEKHHDVKAPFKGGDMRRCPTVAIRLADVGARVYEQLDHPRVAHQTGVSEERLAVGIEAVDKRPEARQGGGRESL